MRLHRFFTDADISGRTVFLSEKDIVHQIIHVLRLAKDDEIILCKDGSDARVRITALSKNGIDGEVISLEKNVAESQRRVVLYCSILKKENFEMVVQKTIEVGVSEVVPLKTKRTIKAGVSENRLKKIAKEAAEQCGRARIPVIRESMEFLSALDMSSRAKQSEVEGSALIRVNILYDASGQDAKDFFENQQMKGTSIINVFIGPEGGWDEEELRIARERGFTVLSLGVRTLRAETAAIVGTFLATSL